MLFAMPETESKEFVEYVFWYYVLARNAAENTVTATTLFGERMTQFLLRLALKHARIGMQLSDGRRVGRFNQKEQALTFERRDIPHLLDLHSNPVNRRRYSPALFDPPYARNTPAKPFWLHTTEFVDNLVRGTWRTVTEAGEEFRLDDQDRLPAGFLDQQIVVKDTPISVRDHFFADRAPALAYRGGVFHTIVDTTIWIVRTANEETLKSLRVRRTKNERATLIGVTTPVAKGRDKPAIELPCPAAADPLIRELDYKNVLERFESTALQWPLRESPATPIQIRWLVGDALRFLARGRPTDDVYVDRCMDDAITSLQHSALRAHSYWRRADAEVLILGMVVIG
jgi:hypothetical protein